MAKKKADKNFRFYVGSLIDPNPSDYMAICNQFGEVIEHTSAADLFAPEVEEVEEVKEEPKIDNQIKLF